MFDELLPQLNQQDQDFLKNVVFYKIQSLVNEHGSTRFIEACNMLMKQPDLIHPMFLNMDFQPAYLPRDIPAIIRPLTGEEQLTRDYVLLTVMHDDFRANPIFFTDDFFKEGGEDEVKWHNNGARILSGVNQCIVSAFLAGGNSKIAWEDKVKRAIEVVKADLEPNKQEDIIELKPNFCGIGLNINALIRKIMGIKNKKST